MHFGEPDIDTPPEDDDGDFNPKVETIDVSSLVLVAETNLRLASAPGKGNENDVVVDAGVAPSDGEMRKVAGQSKEYQHME